MLRIGVVGAGSWGLNHVRVASTETGCVLRVIADPDPEALHRARQIAPGAIVTTLPEQVFADPEVDAVIIASPSATHARLTNAALHAGKHVLVEKPLAMTFADALVIERNRRAAGRVCMVGHLMVHHPAVQRLREMLRSGTLGHLHYLHSTRVNLGKLRRDENALWSFGPHDLSIIDYLLARSPVSVAARGQSALQPGVEDVVFMTLRFASGEMAHVHLSWLHPRKERRVTLVCSQKMVEFDDVATDKLRVYDKGYDRPREFTEYAQYLTLRDGDVYIPQVHMQEPLRLQLRHFLEAILGAPEYLANVESGVRVVAVLEAAQRSLESDGLTVSVPEIRLEPAVEMVERP